MLHYNILFSFNFQLASVNISLDYEACPFMGTLIDVRVKTFVLHCPLHVN